MPTVHIEFRRVQTWLFSVPRLRAMVGANALLGRMLREQLPDLAKRADSDWKLCAAAAGSYPDPNPEDPLRDHDNPCKDAEAGILARDGGHFEACFESGAEEFAQAAARLIRRELPGLRFTAHVSAGASDTDEASSLTPPAPAVSIELPVLARCRWAARGVASAYIEQGDEKWIDASLDTKRRHETAKNAASGKTKDIATLLTKATQLDGLTHAEDFSQLAGSGYLAVIHADGNGVGSSAPDPKADPAGSASFHHRNRVLVRRALKTAVNAAIESARKADPKLRIRPLELLMVGGDDVLVVCRAALALPFVVELCRELDALQPAAESSSVSAGQNAGEKAGDGKGFRLTLGVGVAVGSPTLPFHRLHALAETLASSAKRLYRGGEDASVVDWAVYTASWAEDPIAVRRRDWVRGPDDSRRLLSRRPLLVLGDGLQSLAGLVAGAEKLAAPEVPRSQLRFLVDQLPRGMALANLAFEELSPAAREALAGARVTAVWDGQKPAITSVLDLVEVAEMGRLGRAKAPAGAE